MKRHPGSGWVRADEVPTEATVSEILALRKRISELEAEAQADRVRPPEGTEDLEQGEDAFKVSFTLEGALPLSGFNYENPNGTVKLTWNEIFAGVAPAMINEASDEDLREAFYRLFDGRVRQFYSKQSMFHNNTLPEIVFEDEEIDTCIVQLRALGLIRESTRQRSVRDTNTYWSLTPYGDYLMSQLRAIRREPINPAETELEVVPEKGRLIIEG